jgi:hypothetical protein
MGEYRRVIPVIEMRRATIEIGGARRQSSNQQGLRRKLGGLRVVYKDAELLEGVHTSVNAARRSACATG